MLHIESGSDLSSSCVIFAIPFLDTQNNNLAIRANPPSLSQSRSMCFQP